MDFQIRCNLTVSILFYIIAIGLAQNECFPGTNSPGYVVPRGDIIIEYGNPLDITCVLHDSAVQKYGPNASQHLRFLKNNETVQCELIKVINSSAILLHIDKPHKTSGDSYSCLVKKDEFNAESVCMSFVTVGTAPQTVKDFDCIGYNYDNLTCTWTAPENYVKTKYKLIYTLRGSGGKFKSRCPEIKVEDGNRMSCLWNVSTSPPYRLVHHKFYFTITMENQFGINQINKEINHFARVIPGPPENLKVISATSSSLYLHWYVPESMLTFPPGIHQTILYRCENDEIDDWHFGGIITKNLRTSEMSYNLTNLKSPHRECEVKVSLRSAAASESDYSMWSNATIFVINVCNKSNSIFKDNPDPIVSYVILC